MIVLAGLILGVVIGALTARRRKGNSLDILQYAAGYGIAFMLVGLFLTLILHRLAA